MIRISLLPQGQSRPAQVPLPPHTLLWTGAVATALVGVTVFYVWQYSQLRELKGRLGIEQSQLQQVSAELQRATSIANGERSVAERESRLRQLKGRAWSPLLLELSQITPRGVTWLHLSLAGDILTIQGRAEQMGDIAHFMASLTGSPTVKHVDLHSAKDEEIGGNGGVRELNFELTVQLIPLQGGNSGGT